MKAWGHKTECFTDPIKALETFRDAPNDYAVALLDIRMPHMTGTELAMELVKIRRNLPIVFMSAFEFDLAMFSDLPLAYKQQDVVKKPYAPIDLCKAVKPHLVASSA